MEHTKDRTKVKETVVLVAKDAKTGRVVKIVETGPNLITNAGDLYYAEQGTGSTPTIKFFNAGQLVAAPSGVVISKAATFGFFSFMDTFSYSGQQNFESGYPKVGDTDTDNTGRTADAITYKRIFTTSQANYTIKAVGVCRSGGATSSSGELLSYKTLASADYIVKTSSLTVTLYVNHTFLGT